MQVDRRGSMLTTTRIIARTTVITVLSLSSVSEAQDRVRLDDAVRKQCLQILRTSLRADEFWPSIHAAEGLTLAGHGGEVRSYLGPKMAGQKDDQKRCGLARELVRAGDIERRQIMLDILAGSDSYGHTHAAESLFKVSQIGNGVALRAALQQSDNLKLKVMAAAALGRSGDQPALLALRSLLVGKDATARQLSAWVLGRIGDKRDLPSLRQARKRTKDPLEHAYFVHSLAALGDVAGR
ncbi:MAG: HEAT repeat domain-containing protein, partial [Planctomycetaceae bacterium]